jgi:dTDP-4-dehydrorhamnose reductase
VTRVLLLGANGQLGVDVRRLAEGRRGIELCALTRADVDLADLDETRRRLAGLDFDALINATGYHKTDEVERNAERAVLINAYAPKTLAEICLAKGARLVHLSTDYVFGGQAKREPLTEADPPAPVNVYGATKLMGEALIFAAGADALVARVSSLYGVAGASGKGGNFVETMIRLAREKGALRVVDDQVMAPTATADVAEALLRAIEAKPPAGLYHVVGSGQASWFEFAKAIVAGAGLGGVPVEPVPSSAMPTPARRPAYSALSNGKLTQTLGWTMPVWRESLERYLRAKGHKG